MNASNYIINTNLTTEIWSKLKLFTNYLGVINKWSLVFHFVPFNSYSGLLGEKIKTIDNKTSHINAYKYIARIVLMHLNNMTKMFYHIHHRPI